jgi:glucuronyl/N-acetylglucosaminyl transferase EXT1
LDNYRQGFDVSFPLFHRNHPLIGPQFQSSTIDQSVNGKHNLLVFKGKDYLILKSKWPLVDLWFEYLGKRYIYGIGSETRNSLFHLHNDKDILIYTTCKHGKYYKQKDDKCDQNQLNYDKYFININYI